MSIQAVGWVFEHSRSKGIARLVLLSLANHHNAGTGQCNPGQRRIAHEAGISPSTVSDAIHRLVRLGELEVIDLGLGTRSTEYHLPWLSSVLRDDVPRRPPVLGSRAQEEPVARGSRALPDGQRAASARSGPASARNRGSSARPGPRETRTGTEEPLAPDVAERKFAEARQALGRPR